MWALSGATVALHVFTALVSPYEFHRDEFLYMAMGRNLRLFAMDFPPMIALLSEAQRALSGDGLWSLRLAPALAHGLLVLLTGLIAARLGGTRFAQVLAMLATATGPLYLRAGSLFQPVVFDQLWWTLALYALILIAADAPESTPRLKHWQLFGLACGLGLLTKFSILALGFGVFCAMLISRREWLRTRRPWLAAALALLVGAPSWIGQIQLDMPVVAQMGALQEGQLERVGYGEFLAELILMHGPAFLLAVAGAFALAVKSNYRHWRIVGLACAITFFVIMALRGKPYYVGPLFPTLYAAGAVVLAVALARIRKRAVFHAARVLAMVLITSWGLFALPLSLPLFSAEQTARFAAAIGITAAVKTNQDVILELPQDYADMLGWQHKVEEVAQVYHSLPPRDRQDAVIVASNYGQAGAIDFYGARLGLPEAEVPIGSYWFWGPGQKPGRVIVKVGGERDDLARFCRSVELGRRIEERWVVPEEQNLAIWICREPYRTLQQIWPEFKGRN